MNDTRKQVFEVEVETKKVDGCGSKVKAKSEGEIRRAVADNLSNIASVNVTEVNIREQVANVLRRYFEFDDVGNHNPQFNEDFSAQEAIDEIHIIIGNFYAKQEKED